VLRKPTAAAATEPRIRAAVIPVGWCQLVDWFTGHTAADAPQEPCCYA